MWKRLAAGVVISVLLGTGMAAAGEPQSCRTVRISDVGWTDNEAMNGFATVVLEALGYEPEVTVLAMPVLLRSMKNKDIDVQIDFWTPGADALTDPYIKDGSIEKVRTNLTGAQYTLAVPDYVWNAGLKDFSDIARFKDKLDGKIYGIEPGNDGNHTILQMIEKDAAGLGGFELVESSEQGMLSQLTRMERGKDWIVFLGWSPHPMNYKHDINYLTGGEEWFGASSSGWTAARAGYLDECPNVGKFLKNLNYSIEMMNETMGAILDKGESGKDAATRWMKEHPELLDGWLDGVTTFQGEPGLPAVKKSLGMS